MAKNSCKTFSGNDEVAFDAEIVRETDKAILLRTDCADRYGNMGSRETWFPKSQIARTIGIYFVVKAWLVQAKNREGAGIVVCDPAILAA